MESAARELPADVDALIVLVHTERAERDLERARHQTALAQRDETISQRDEKIAKLEHTVDLFAKWLWGPRSEKRQSAQLMPVAGQSYLPFAELLAAAQRVADQHGAQGSIEIELPMPPAKKHASKPRRQFPEHLPLVRTTIEVPESERACCETPMQEMGAEVTRELERIELAVVHEIARKKYCCRVCQEHVLTAPGPTRAIDKGILGNGWLATLLVERFQNHMPYHRLEKKYQSEGIDLSRSVLCRSAGELGERFTPVFDALCAEVVKDDVAFADETTVVVQMAKDGTSKKAQVWLYANKHGDCVFDYNESRGRDSPQKILANFRGYLHDDGYCVYEACLDPSRVRHVACWAHVRRKFVDAEKTDATLSKEAVAWIAKLYVLDRQAKEQELSAEDVKTQREEHAPAILAGFREWLDVRRTQVLPQSPMAKAIEYAIGRWQALGSFIEDGRLELDNNRAERALRTVAVGRKNWMVVGNERGGRTASVFYSLVMTCKNRAIDPRTYLHDAMLRLKEGVDPKTLTPAEWQRRFAAQVADRRSYVLAQILGRLGA
jgi:transposase